ncbi:DUF4129 domain-containing protein [Chamaesiphon minutus]|uniref:Transglutaminase-like enzyme, predicted cysteine protease n=1 Tax=Chamaesiphon minutus (strain ATCC 27169 / PCC 6605) TaxID=1173020 RepID=K9UJ88_CHAP6|nr:DUF4129 domain-containing protein [Chamaesiphon minutus]AFY94723.1 transglutaminase-like enzyme, predicted cysteine protease [Chamaesiphon minutus PCC 6605]
MGIFVFVLALVASIWALRWITSGLNLDIGSSRKEPIVLNYPRAAMSVEPIVKPVDEVKIPERLPQIFLDYVPSVVPTPASEAQSEISANFTIASSAVEESLLFRLMVLALFILSVINTDLAAGTHYSAICLPITIFGTFWSYTRRHHAKHWLNISVSVVSSALVIGYLTPLLVRQTQNAIDGAAPTAKLIFALALTLGTICIGLQMGLSCHLYSRRLLGYCMVASITLMAVAASLSQNGLYLLLLAGFIAIGIPTLMLDYRSRLGLKPVGITSVTQLGQLPYHHLPWKYLSQLAAIAIGLGLVVALFLPNFSIPQLSLQPPGLDRLQIPQKPLNLGNNSRFSNGEASPTNSSPQLSLPPQPTAKELAAQVFGQPGNDRYPDTISQPNLSLPPELASQLRQSVQNILATSPQPLKSDYDRASYLGEYLQQHYQSDPNQVNTANLPPLDAKLIQQLTAACATAPTNCKLVGSDRDIPVVYTSMLRSIGIPSRLKTGETLSQIDPQTKLYQRPPAQFPGKTEVYIPNWGWLGLNSTPTGNQQPALLNLDARQIAQLQAQVQQLAPTPPPSVTPTLPTPPTSPANPASLPPTTPATPVNLAPSPPTIPSPLDRSDLPLPLLKTFAIVAAIGSVLGWYWWRNHLQQQELARLPPVEQIYRSMLATLSQQGRTRLPTQTQLEYAQSIATTEHPQIAKVVWEISQLYTAWRYGKQPIDIRQLAKKLQYFQHLQQLAAARKRQQWFVSLNPTSSR